MSEDYWNSEPGILIRLEDLAEFIAYTTYNNAIQVYASKVDPKYFTWRAVMDHDTCDYCASQNGRLYRRGQFMPAIPAHPGCRCVWDVTFEKE